MGDYHDTQFQKDICRELMSIRKNLEIIAEAASIHAKAEKIELGISDPYVAFKEEKRQDRVPVLSAKPYYVIAVDFDGTLCIDEWPIIGPPIQSTIDYVKARKAEGAKLILWTNRVGYELDVAVQWCNERGIFFDAVNENLPEMIEFFGSDSRKIFADEFLDDRSKQPQLGYNDLYISGGIYNGQ